MRASRYLLGVLAFLTAVASPLPAPAQSEGVSFTGKQIRLLIGYSPTGYGYDTYGRLLARHLGKYLPGNPTFVVNLSRDRSNTTTHCVGTPGERAGHPSTGWCVGGFPRQRPD